MRVYWKSCHSTDPCFRYHPVGLAGVVYPPQYLAALKRAGSAFESCCPTQDDVWHHVIALRAGFKTRQILLMPPYFAFYSIPGTSRTALKGRDGDEAILATYREPDIELLRKEWFAAHREQARRQSALGTSSAPEI